MLHITNGDAANETLRRAGIPGEMLAWADCLHEGPVPSGLDLEALSSVRAEYIAKAHRSDLRRVLAAFRERDRRLTAFREHGEIVLWSSFELYDQLHLLQLLDWFSRQNIDQTRLSVVFIAEYLGMMRGEKPVQRFAARRGVTRTLLALGRRGWAAFRAENPSGLAELARQHTAEAPYLQKALYRILEELPDHRQGLSRTERQILASVNGGVTGLKSLFKSVRQMEHPAFMGDASFWVIVSDLTLGPNPPLAMAPGRAFPFPDERTGVFPGDEDLVSLTKTGERILAGNEDLVSINGVDRWLGGIRLTGSKLWRWDRESKFCVFK